MTAAIRRGFALILTTTLALPAVTAAQTEWDPDDYLPLVQAGDVACERALATPESDSAYEEHLTECLQARERALEMLRRAVLAGEIPERWHAEVTLDLFNLTENVIVMYVLLDQCIAADTVLGRALAEPDTLPAGAAEHLELLHTEVDDCRDEHRNDALAFDAAAYESFVVVADTWYARADDPTLPEEDRNAAWLSAFQSYDRAIALLRNALLEGEVKEEARVAALFAHYERLIHAQLALGFCENAARSAQNARADAELLAADAQALGAREAEVEDCRERLVTLAEREREGAREVEISGPVLPEQASFGVAPYVLWGVAGAAAIAAVTLDLTGAGDRDELDALRADCATGPCDFARSEQLANDLNERKIGIAVLAGAGLVTAAVGTLLYFIERDAAEAPSNGREPAPAVGVPRFGFSGIGGSVSVTF